MADDGTPGHGTGAHASLTTVTGPSTIDEIHALFAGLSPGAVESTALAQFELAVVEIAANIVEHAGRGEPVTLDLELTLLPDRAEAIFHDDGRAADVDLESVSFPDELAEHGRGLAIALECLDELTYRRADDRNTWRLVRTRDG
ncbi:ATP-binding protein [Rhodococcus phenolicus]|uniref:ATP-binding protein n=1 Tax=Rhodococcus phenolicus TaxID=263849 RepID=UPI00082D3331|nr:ATP-binding protein [Rhodococcus phenolicus]